MLKIPLEHRIPIVNDISLEKTKEITRGRHRSGYVDGFEEKLNEEEQIFAQWDTIDWGRKKIK